jgi:hypothetical protein
MIPHVRTAVLDHPDSAQRYNAFITSSNRLYRLLGALVDGTTST